MTEYDGYQIHGETQNSKKKIAYWEAAIGLQRVDDLTPSKYLIELAQQNVDGKLSYKQVESLLYSHYEDETPEERRTRTREGDLVAARIVSILDSPNYPLKITSLTSIHKKLFQDIYEHAGQFRTVNIYKDEPILDGETVKYTAYGALRETLEYDIEQEKQKTYAGLDMTQIVKRIASFTSCLWQAHPFMEGNTRTVAVFMECYLNYLGFPVDNTMFKMHSKYFRNALVRANYADYPNRIAETDEYLIRFYTNLLTDQKTALRNRDLILRK